MPDQTTSGLAIALLAAFAGQTTDAMPHAPYKIVRDVKTCWLNDFGPSAKLLLVSERAEAAVPAVSEVRRTTTREELIGELREWALLDDDWDGEGGMASNGSSRIAAVQFVRLLKEDMPLPNAMLHASGNAGLLWDDGALYADLQFKPDGRIAYFIEKNGNRHKGWEAFDNDQLPHVLAAALES